uniref:Peptidase M12B propeptide domain-containing protein n=1 Tax=Hucho hucho TaxID=62062 RepID=A0A4W5LQ40_9TELE
MDSVCVPCADGTVYSLPSLFTSSQSISRHFLQGLPQSEVVHPYRVDAKGHFLSNFLSHRVSRVQRRETPGEPGNPARVFYQLQHGGHNLHFNLTLNPHLLAPGFLTEKRYGGLEGAKIRSHGPSLCHFIGDVWDRATMKGRAAISTCDGLVNFFFKQLSLKLLRAVGLIPALLRMCFDTSQVLQRLSSKIRLDVIHDMWVCKTSSCIHEQIKRMCCVYA